MEPRTRIICCWIVVVLFFSSSMLSDPQMLDSVEGPAQDMPGEYVYKRSPEVEKECSSVLSSNSDLQYDGQRIAMIHSLSFEDGEWKQSNGSKLLVPVPMHNATREVPFRSAWFHVWNVKQQNQVSRVIVRITGSLTMRVTTSRYEPERQNFPLKQFEFMPGFSSLDIIFEGIYAESDDNGGEIIMCMLGKTSKPSPKPGLSGEIGSNQFTLLPDDKIRMVLRYPRVLSLTKRTVHGEVMSLRDQTDALYFDKINLSSVFESSYKNYQFGSEELISKTCNPYPYQDRLLSNDIIIYKASRVCDLLRMFQFEPFSIITNWKCNYNEVNYCNNLGPFKPSNVEGEANDYFLDYMLYMQNVRCEPQPTQGNVSSVKVSAVFRASHPMTDQNFHRRLSSLENMMLSVEGTWSSEDGQLCMVGCLNADGQFCNARVLIYFPVTFTISQRNAIFGSISSSSVNGSATYYPLSFGRMVHPYELSAYDYMAVKISYRYTKRKEYASFFENNEPFDINAFIKKSFLRYPKIDDKVGAFSFSNLAEDLSFNSRIVTGPLNHSYIQMGIFSIGSLVGRFSLRNSSELEKTYAMTEIKETKLLLNVSSTLTVRGNLKYFSNISKLLLEGIYNSVDGKMYLIGCRYVHAPQNVSFDSGDLENGMDCLIHVKIEYPPVTARWLVNQAVKISISSQRNADDPLHFSQIDVQTFPITYHLQRESMLSQRTVEGVLQSLMLSLTVACIFSQLFFIRKDTSVPYTSMVMIGFLALGYSIPLISGAEALFFGRKSKSNNGTLAYLQDDLFPIFISYLVKILFLTAFLLILRLLQKVWKSRRRLLSSMSSDSRQVPSERWVFFTCLCIHVVGFLVVVSTNAVSEQVNTTGTDINPTGIAPVDFIESGKFIEPRGWGIELEEYVGMVQDFFLLPQVIGNLLWQLDGKPLRKMYYIGITIVRILPHLYDSMSAKQFLFGSYAVGEEMNFVNPHLDFYSRFGDIAIPIVASLLAIIVYCQQRWSFQKLWHALCIGRFKNLLSEPKSYERLPILPPETELSGMSASRDGSRS